MWRTAPVVVSRGDIQLGGYYFSTQGYEPPHYTRAMSLDDTFEWSAAKGKFVPVRNVVDQGLNLGVWKSFTVLCHNHDDYDRMVQRYRGLLIFNRLKTLMSYVSQAWELREMQTGNRYTVMFGPDGMDPTFLVKPNQQMPDPATGFFEDMGPEYNVQISLVEVDP